MNVTTIIGLTLVLIVIVWLKWFSEGWIESREWHKKEKIKGEGRWQWLTSKPYITLEKIRYWLVLLVILSVYLYIGFNLPL